MFLTGEPGVGKTRLAQEVTLYVRNGGFLVARGRCYEPDENVPYYPFHEALSMFYEAAPVALRGDPQPVEDARERALSQLLDS